MIEWQIEFDVCALIIQLVFCVVYVQKKKPAGVLTQLYEMMMGCLFTCTICEIVVMQLWQIPSVNQYFIVIVQCFYLAVNMALCGMFSIYVFLMARKGKYTSGRWYWFVGYGTNFFMILVTLSSPFTGWVFMVRDGVMEAGWAFYIVYLVCGIYVLLGGVFCIYYRHAIDKRDRLTLYAFIVALLCGTIYQFVTIKGLVIYFLATVGMVLLNASRQSNNERMDSVSGLYNKAALRLIFNELQNHSTPFYVIAVAPVDFAGFVHKNGNLAGDAVIGTLGSRFFEAYGSKRAYYIGGGSFAVVLTDENYHENVEKIRALVEEQISSLNYVYNLSMCGCSIHYPSYLREGDLLDYLEKGMDIAVKSGEAVLITENNFTQIRDNIVLRLEREQEELQEKKKEAELGKEEAERAALSKSTFLAQMSHEIRTPLTTIMGMTEILLRGDLSEGARNNVETIFTAGRSLLQIINDILDFSKIEAGRFEIVEEPYNIASTLDNVTNVLKVRCGTKPIKLNLDIEPEIPAVLKGDEGRLKQIFGNLLSNAAKYTDAGSITLRVDWDRKNSELIVEVTDTGRGIREEDMTKLFGSFNRLDAYKNKAIEGTGLGLAITKRIVELMGGSINAKSVYGKGSTFSFAVKQEVVKDTPVAKVIDKENKHVYMYITDAEREAELKGIFERLGVELTVNSSFEALYAKNRFNYVLLDTDTYKQFKEDNGIIDRDKMKVILLPWESDTDEASDERYVAIHYPICSLSVAGAFINEAVNSPFHGSAIKYFIAPDVRVLVVDDNSFNRTIAQELMAPHRMQIDQAEGGREGIEMIKRNKYDMIFLDHMMPGMDGIETLGIIREMEEFKKTPVPVVAFTANAVSGMKEEFKTAGFNDFLSKPISVDRMESILLAYLPPEKLQMLSKEEFAALKSEPKNEKEAISENYGAENIKITGADIALGLSHVGNDTEKYLKLLDVILSESKAFTERVGKAYSEKNIKNYTIEVHALKSTMASIGATALSEEAKALEAAGHREDTVFIEAKHERLMKNYAEMLEEIGKAVADYHEFVNAHEAGNEGGYEKLSKLRPDFDDCLTSIKLLNEECEFEAATRLTELYEKLSSDNGEQEILRKLSELYQVYDYQGVSEYLENI